MVTSFYVHIARDKIYSQEILYSLVKEDENERVM